MSGPGVPGSDEWQANLFVSAFISGFTSACVHHGMSRVDAERQSWALCNGFATMPLESVVSMVRAIMTPGRNGPLLPSDKFPTAIPLVEHQGRP